PQSETQSESQEIEYVPEEEREREVEVEAEIKADDRQDGVSRKTSKDSGPSINVSTSTPTIGRGHGGNGTGKDQGRTPTRQMFGPREPRSPPRSPPPPMAAALAMGSPPMTPTLPKTFISSTTSFGSGGSGVVSQSPEPEPAGTITAAVSIPLPTSPPTSDLGDPDVPITTSPQPRARLGRSNTASRRPAAGMWEEHNLNVLDNVPKGLGRNPWKEEEVHEEVEDKDKKQRNPWERHRSGSGSGSGSGGMSSRRSKRNYKDDLKTSNSKDDQDHDTEDAYSGMAV
ncbi:hypothetical protein H0H93_009423, partial [Arthromyces matolae]